MACKYHSSPIHMDDFHTYCRTTLESDHHESITEWVRESKREMVLLQMAGDHPICASNLRIIPLLVAGFCVWCRQYSGTTLCEDGGAAEECYSSIKQLINEQKSYVNFSVANSLLCWFWSLMRWEPIRALVRYEQLFVYHNFAIVGNPDT